MKKLLPTLTLSVFLTACAATGNHKAPMVVDGSSNSSTLRSLRVMKGESIASRCLIETAVRRILEGDPSLLPANGNGLGQKLDGMTVQEVVQFSENYPPLGNDRLPNRGNCTP